MRRILLFQFILLLSGTVFAQSTSVTGKVTDAGGNGVPGVSVFVKGTGTGAVTDADGRYSVDATSGILVFSFIGYKTVEAPIDGRTSIDITLEEDVTALDELVVIGYGTQQKKDLTGAVGVVGSEAMESRPNTQFGNLIQGKTAGVQVVTPSGKPSAGFSIRVRGTNSITGGSEPLYLVDGVPSSDTRSLNPADIETVTVLKDAASAAIYGAQGANGVVLITTKRGNSATPRFEFSTYLGSSSAWRTLKVLNSEQYRDLMTELGQTTDWSRYTANTDWQNKVFQNGTSQNYQLGVSGKNGGTSYYLSGGWTQQIGAVRSSEMDRYNFKLSLDQKVNDFISLGGNINYVRYHDVDVADNQAVNQGGVILGMLSTPPNIGVYNSNGTFTSNPFQDWENPLSSTDGSDRGYKNHRVLGNVYTEFTIIKDLKFRSNLGIDFQTGMYDYFLDPFRTSFGRAKLGIARNNTDMQNFYIFDNVLTYSKTISNHAVTAMAGWVTQKRKWESNAIETNGFANDAVPTTGAGSIIVSASNTKAEKTNASFIARLTYDYSSKYLLQANFRADGSSAFGAGKRWGYFPSVSVGWRLSEEPFLKDQVSFLDDLKLRASWGVVGNDQIANYLYAGLVNPGANYPIGGVIQPGNYPSTIENQDLKWEEAQQTNIGVDLSLLNSRINVTIDAYVKNTYDLLLSVQLPVSTGYPEGIQNVGKLQNKGLEFQISSVNLTGDLSWQTDFNISFNRNKVVDILNQQQYYGGIAGRGEVSLAQEGKPLGMFYGYVYGGVDPATGDVYYLDSEGESTFTPNSDTDRRYIGNPNPDFIYGMTNTLSYKNFSFSIFFQGVQGNDVFNATRVEMIGMSDVKNQSVDVKNRWRQPGDQTNMPRAVFGSVANSRISTRFVENGSYLRAKAVTLSYNVPTTWLNRIKMNSARLYVTGENLFTITKYKGFDPEVNAFGSSNTVLGVDYGTYPQTRNLIVGLNITF